MSNCYIHIPFCDLKCKYCRFASIWKIQNLHIEKYVSFLCEEIKKSNYQTHTLNTIYFGWWTPSVLNYYQLQKILINLKNKFKFNKDIEISLEATPNNITKQNLENYKKLWINRLSIWVQTFNEKALQEINRWNKNDIKNFLYNIKNFNTIENINLDFIIWLPYVKKWEILKNIKYIINNYNQIKHISVYMLEDYYSKDKIIETKYDNITYPKIWKKLWLKEEEFLEEYSQISNFLNKNWFHRYEISNFAKKWYECIHNKWYWNFTETIAFGLGAYALIKTNNNLIRTRNSENFEEYYKNKKFFEILDKNDIFIEKIIFALRTNGLNQELYKKLKQEKINYFLKNWYLKKESDKIILTDSWILILDFILQEII